MSIPTLVTSRLVLRPFSERDVDPLHHILGDPDALRYFPNPKTPSREAVQRLIAGQLTHWEEYGYGWWAVEERSHLQDGQRAKSGLIGWCGLGYLPETDETEVAYLLGVPFWGKGYATEAAQASLRYGFETIGVACVVGIVHPENVASRRVLAKLGMSFLDEAHYFGMDCHHYAIDRASYRPNLT